MEQQFIRSQASPESVVTTFEYEVFLSFRGPDVRKSFADCLYSCLDRSKIRTFRDEEELGKGELIAPSLVEAITGSKIHIPILTKSYAASKWCLQELAKMLECRRQGKGHIILPIFYFVDPRDVRHQAGPYTEAFEQHSEKHDRTTVQEWREALQQVGQMKGWHITETDGHGAVIDQVFSMVELHLRSMYALVTDELVGIDVHLQEVTRLLDLDSGDARIVGIHGIGGMGKTTIAKAVYDKICTNFNRCCFLENVKEMLSKQDGIIALQIKLISSIVRGDVQLKQASEGLDMIRERVSKYKVLIVLDDVDDSLDFGQTLGRLGHFSSGSRFIITTRDERVLEFLQEYKLYKPGEMSHGHCVQLFSKYAFRLHNPPQGYATLCDEFVKVAARLPLALKVIGSLLFRRDISFWEEKLMELKQVPATSNKVQQRLKVSYDELTHSEKQIFLDVACFFIGEDKEMPSHMWRGRNFYPESGIRTLILRSLIKIDEKNRLWMHDLLRDLGRAIVIEEDVEHPCKRSRIWSNEDAVNMLKHGEGTDRVEMLRVDMRAAGGYCGLTEKELKKMSGLKYLDVMHGNLTGDLSGILSDMRWLRLYKCNSVPDDLNLKKVAILDLEDCRMTDDWRGWNRIQVAHKLKVINLHGCHKLNMVPDLSQCKSLESIDVTYCFGMRGVLDISCFRDLKVVRFLGTEITALIGDMKKLQKLQEIRMGKLVWRAEQQVPALPTTLKRLTTSSPKVPNLLELIDLEELCYMGCDTAPVIPGAIWQLPNLKSLRLFQCTCNGSLLLVSDENGYGALPSSLTSLILGWCHLDRLPNLGNLNNLTELRLDRIEVYEIEGLEELRALEVLEISHSLTVYNLHGLENLLHLKELTLESCGLESLPNLSTLIELHKLVIIGCWSLSEIQGLAELRGSLIHLEVSECGCLEQHIQGLESLEALESLTLDSRKLFSGLSDIHHQLQNLTLTEDDEEDIPPIPDQYPNPFEPFPDLSRLEKLKQLSISGWRPLPEVRGLGGLKSLQSLKMKACTTLRSLPNLSGLDNLETLDVGGCTQLVDVTGLSRLESLQKLYMSNCWSIEELPDISGLKNLESLDVSECRNLIKVTGLDKLELLRELHMADCKTIKELPDLSNLKNLEILDLDRCKQLKKVKGLEKLDRLWLVSMDTRLQVKYLLKVVVWAGREVARSAVNGALRKKR